jgi:hypothetical protein
MKTSEKIKALIALQHNDGEAIVKGGAKEITIKELRGILTEVEFIERQVMTSKTVVNSLNAFLNPQKYS